MILKIETHVMLIILINLAIMPTSKTFSIKTSEKDEQSNGTDSKTNVLTFQFSDKFLLAKKSQLTPESFEQWLKTRKAFQVYFFLCLKGLSLP